MQLAPILALLPIAVQTGNADDVGGTAGLAARERIPGGDLIYSAHRGTWKLETED